MLWIQNAACKVPPDFGERENTGLYFFTRFAVDYPVFPPYAALIENVVLPNLPIFWWMTLLVEAGLGAFLLIGLATRFWAVVGVVQSLAITLSVLNAPNEWHWSYYLMILAHDPAPRRSSRAHPKDRGSAPSPGSGVPWTGASG